MIFEFLNPVSDEIQQYAEHLSQHTIGKKMRIHTMQSSFSLQDVQIVLIGVSENRNSVNPDDWAADFDEIRKAFYALYRGNWDVLIADLGDIINGKTAKDTYYALKTILRELIEQGITPVILGGSQDLTYANYRAYDDLLPMVNIVNVDSKFDLGDSSKPINNHSYIGKIILEKPYNLFNYSTVGYQTYFNSQEEIDLMERLHFESYRLGQVTNNIQLIEPVMRDANIVSIDMNAVMAIGYDCDKWLSPNGFDGKQICSISRYAGISNKVSSFGIYEYRPQINPMSSMLIAQTIWYFIEGYVLRINDDEFHCDESFQKFTVLVDEQDLKFLKSKKSERWWIEIPFSADVNNKLKKYSLLPCTHQDYLDACANVIPDRWFKATKRNHV